MLRRLTLLLLLHLLLLLQLHLLLVLLLAHLHLLDLLRRHLRLRLLLPRIGLVAELLARTGLTHLRWLVGGLVVRGGARSIGVRFQSTAHRRDLGRWLAVVCVVRLLLLHLLQVLLLLRGDRWVACSWLRLLLRFGGCRAGGEVAAGWRNHARSHSRGHSRGHSGGHSCSRSSRPRASTESRLRLGLAHRGLTRGIRRHDPTSKWRLSGLAHHRSLLLSLLCPLLLHLLLLLLRVELLLLQLLGLLLLLLVLMLHLLHSSLL